MFSLNAPRKPCSGVRTRSLPARFVSHGAGPLAGQGAVRRCWETGESTPVCCSLPSTHCGWVPSTCVCVTQEQDDPCAVSALVCVWGGETCRDRPCLLFTWSRASTQDPQLGSVLSLAGAVSFVMSLGLHEGDPTAGEAWPPERGRPCPCCQWTNLTGPSCVAQDKACARCPCGVHRGLWSLCRDQPWPGTGRLAVTCHMALQPCPRL